MMPSEGIKVKSDYAKRLAEFKKCMTVAYCYDEKRVMDTLKYILSLPERRGSERLESGTMDPKCGQCQAI